jgi:hypothetical protein
VVSAAATLTFYACGCSAWEVTAGGVVPRSTTVLGVRTLGGEVAMAWLLGGMVAAPSLQDLGPLGPILVRGAMPWLDCTISWRTKERLVQHGDVSFTIPIWDRLGLRGLVWSVTANSDGGYSLLPGADLELKVPGVTVQVT